MTTELLLALAAFVVISSITPGPNNLMLMASGANFGVRRTLPHITGVLCGFNLMLWLVGAGLMGVIQAMPGALLAMKVLSAFFLLYLAWKIATATPLEKANDSASNGKPLTFIQAAAFQWINPKAWALSIAVTGAYVDSGQAFVSIAIIALAFLLLGTPCSVTWLMLGSQLRRLFANPKQLRIFNVVCAALLVATIWPILSAV